MGWRARCNAWCDKWFCRCCARCRACCPCCCPCCCEVEADDDPTEAPKAPLLHKGTVPPVGSEVSTAPGSQEPGSAQPPAPPPAPVPTPEPQHSQNKPQPYIPDFDKAPPHPEKPFQMLVGKPTADVRSQYEFQGILGRGSTGIVRKLVDKKTKREYACKSIMKRRLTRPQDVNDVKREIEVMHHISGHPNVVTLHGVYEDRNSIHLVMDLCSGGELFDSIVDKGSFSEKDAADIMRTILKVVAHCHSLGVIHRDIKPENFLWSDASQTELKAIDFGLSTFYKPGNLFRDLVGSKFYVAPEVLKRSYSNQADIWSCGIVMYLLLTGLPPFLGDTLHDVFDNILRGEIDFESPPWPDMSLAGMDCIKKMLVYHPRQRANAIELLQHEWMKEQGAAPDQPFSSVVLDRVKSFSGMNRLQQVVRKIVAQHLPVEEIMGLKNLFESLDADNSGTISSSKLKSEIVKGNVHINTKEMDSILKAADIDGNGRIDYNEFLAAMMSATKLQEEENLIRAFEEIDKDGSGFITKEELLECVGHFWDAENVEDLLKKVDKNNDGKIDYEEFREMMLQTAQQPSN